MRRLGVALARGVARRVGSLKRDRLERVMRGPRRRRAILGAIFWAMPRAVRRRALERESAVIEWHLTGRADGRHDVRQLVVEDGAATILDGQRRDADLKLTLDGADFLLLATGNASGARLFVDGRLEVNGDPWLAMRVPHLLGSGR